MDLLQDYKNIVDKIKEHIKTELEKRYKDIDYISQYEHILFSFTIKGILFHLDLDNSFLHIYCSRQSYEGYLETFEELFNFIDRVISKELKP